MRSFFRKDVLIFWRDRKEVLISLLSPIAIIIVLHFAFADMWFGDTDEAINIDVGFVMEDDEALGLTQFEEIVQTMDLTEFEREEMLEQATLLSPIELLTSFFNDPEVQSFIHTTHLDEIEAQQQVKDGALDAVVKIPKGFTFDVLRQLLLNEPATSSLRVQIEEQSIASTTLQHVIDGYMDTLNFQFALSQIAEGVVSEPVLPRGELDMIEGIETLSITQYFAIAMSVLFTLFIAVTVASKTTTEKRERVFNRILLTDSHPISYLSGKMGSTFFLAWFQLVLVIIISQILLDVFPGKTAGFWLGALLIITFFALTIAGLSAVFTSITLRMNNTDTANGLFMLVTMLFAALGGSFFPLEAFPDWLQGMSQWTPNGLALVGFLEWFQYGDLASLFVLIVKLVGVFIAFLIVGIGLFPKRGRIA